MSYFTPRKSSWGTPCRHWLSICLLGLALCLCATGAQAKRVALLIGNAKYSAGALHTPPQDVREMSAALKAVGFTDVEVLLDANQNAMKRAVRDFGDKAEGAEMAFVYYSGHGTQAGGENYLIPIGANIKKESDYGIEAVSANEVLRQIAGARPKVAIVVLDACRDNPMAVTRSATKGLGRMDAPTGTMIAFATAPNTTASDEGFYAKALAAEIRKPGQELLDVFRNTTADVKRMSGGTQEPRISEVSITDRVYFLPQQVASLDPVPVPAAEPRKGKPGAPGAAVALGPSLDFGDLDAADRKRQQEEAKAAAQYQTMKANYEKVQGYTGNKTVYEQALKRFIKAYEGASEASGAEAAALLKEAQSQLARLNSKAGESFRDCVNCPEMVWLPKGHFTMGSPSGEAERRGDEGPQHEVNINYDVAAGKYAVTRAQFGQFVTATGYQTDAEKGGGCYVWTGIKWDKDSGKSWREPGYGQTGEHPVACVSWNDAKAYTRWLSDKTGKGYRLLSEAEWEYAARASTSSRYYWGDDGDHTQQCAYANGADQTAKAQGSGITWMVASCSDGQGHTAPVGSFKPNDFGLYDVSGNVWQWVEDVYHDSYSGAPNDGSAWASGGDASRRVLRGGSWYDGPANLRSASRVRYFPSNSDIRVGFRLARTN